MPENVLTHAIETTAKAHGLRTIEQVFTEYREQLATAASVRQRMSFGLSHIRATVKRCDDMLDREFPADTGLREPWDRTREDDLLAMVRTLISEVDAMARAALEGACSRCGRYGGHLQTLNAGTQDEVAFCIECTRKILGGDVD